MINLFSVFSKPMTELNGWTMTDFTLSFSIFQLCLGITGILAGRIVDKKGAKPLMYVGGTLFGLGWFLAGSCTTITTLYLTFGVMAGVGCGLLYNAAIEMTFRVLGIMFFVAIAAVGAMVTLLMVIKEKKAKGE